MCYVVGCVYTCLCVGMYPEVSNVKPKVAASDSIHSVKKSQTAADQPDNVARVLRGQLSQIM